MGLRECGTNGHVECPERELASSDLQFTRRRVVPAGDSPRAWAQSRDGWPVLRLAKPGISTAGFEEPCQAKPAISSTDTMAGRESQCEPLAEAILAKVEVGLSA